MQYFIAVIYKCIYIHKNTIKYPKWTQGSLYTFIRRRFDVDVVRTLTTLKTTSCAYWVTFKLIHLSLNTELLKITRQSNSKLQYAPGYSHLHLTKLLGYLKRFYFPGLIRYSKCTQRLYTTLDQRSTNVK